MKSTSSIDRYSQSSVATPALRDIVQIHSALQQGDDALLMALMKKSPDVAAFQEIVHRSIGVAGYTVDLGVNRRPAYWHGRLWMVPVVLDAAMGPLEQVPNECATWINEWMRTGQIGMIGSALSAQCVLALQPGQTQQLLAGLARFGPEPNIPGAGARMQPAMPSLSFIVGAIKTPGVEPQIPDRDFGVTADKIKASLTFQCSTHKPVAPPFVEVGRPEEFSDAIVSGLSLWFDALSVHFDITGWSMDVLGSGIVSLTLGYCQWDGTEPGSITIPLKHWQLGAAGIERVADIASRWPMSRDLWKTQFTRKMLS